MPVPKDKCKFPLWIHPEIINKVKDMYRENNCRSQSEFIENAIKYYIGYLTANDTQSYLPNAFLSNMKSIVAESDTRQSRLLFKLAVEMAMMMNVLASTVEIDKDLLEKLRGECVKEVKKLNGGFSLEDAVEWQS